LEECNTIEQLNKRELPIKRNSFKLVSYSLLIAFRIARKNPCGENLAEKIKN
jgi:hypothetical protein